MNRTLVANIPCEPHYSKYGLKGSLIGGQNLPLEQRLMSDLVAYSDGTMDLLALSTLFGCNIEYLDRCATQLESVGILSRV